MDDDDALDLRAPDEAEEKRRAKKKKKKHASSASPSKSRGWVISDKIAALAPAVARVRAVLGEALSRAPDPRTTISDCRSHMTLKRFAFMLWMLVIFFSLLNLLGVAPALPSFSAEAAEPMESVTSEEPVAEEIIVQKLPGPQKKINLAMERDFGCRELECIAACNGKAKPKCLKSRSCVIERDKICQKRCRKARCEDRCKDEPHLGYVEREQGLEKCKDGCTGPTATHNKCVVKCHVKYKPCKTKCFEMASKYKCDNPKVLAATSKLIDPGHQSKSSSSSSAASAASDESSSADDDDAAAAEDDDHESSSASSSGHQMALPDDDLL